MSERAPERERTEPFITIDGKEVCVEERALADMLDENILFVNAFPFAYEAGKPAKEGPTVVLFVNANDVFAWGCADAERLPYDEIGPLYKAWKAEPIWGVTKWCCRRRNEQPQPPIVRDMKTDGAWDEAMEALPKNAFSAMESVR